MTISESVNETNSQVCPYQIAFILDNWFRRLLQNPAKIVGEYVHSGDTVIDVGCGPGFFSIDMAKMVGPQGNVVAVDLQQQMLNRVKKKADRHGVSERVQLHRCGENEIGLNAEADFILAYYMVHETPDVLNFFREVNGLLKEKGKLLVVEPRMHVSARRFDRMIETAVEAGLKQLALPSGKGGRGVVLGRR